MAQLVPFDSLKPGMVVYEEWIAGTGCLKTEILDRYKDGWLRMKIWGQFAGTFLSSVNKRPEYRYWDEMPTDIERQKTAWPTKLFND